MAVTSTTPSIQYSANGSTTEFAFTFVAPASLTGGTITNSNGTMTLSDQTLTTTTANVFYTSDLAGKSITVTGAGTSSADLTTTINSVTDGQNVELVDAAATAVSGASFTITTGTYATTLKRNADIQVYVDDTLQTYTTHYTVLLNVGDDSNKQGKVIFGSAPANGTTVTIRRDVELARTADFQSGGSLTAKTLNAEFDSLVMSLQDNIEARKLTIKYPDDEVVSAADSTLPTKSSRFNKLLAFDGSGVLNLTSDITSGDGNVTANVVTANTFVGALTGTVSSIANQDTDNLTEGSTNLYFTNERVDDRVNALFVAGDGLTKTYNDGSNTYTLDGEKASTSARGVAMFDSNHFSVTADAAVSIADNSIDSTLIDWGTGTNQVNSDDVTEGSTQLYYTDAKVLTKINATSVGALSDVVTTGLSSSSGSGNVLAWSTSNQRFEPTPSSISLTATDPLNYNSSTGALTLVADGIDDTHIDFGTGTNQVNTDDLPEGSTNLWYTDGRAQTAAQVVSINNVVEDLTPQLGGNLDVNSKEFTDSAGTFKFVGNTTQLGTNDNTAAEIKVNGNRQNDNKAIKIVGGTSTTSPITAPTITIGGGDNIDIQPSINSSTGASLGLLGLNTRRIRVGENVSADTHIYGAGNGDVYLKSENQGGDAMIILEDGSTGGVQIKSNSTGNSSITLTPNGTGGIVLDSMTWPASDGSGDQVLKTDGSGNLSWTTVTTGGLGNVSEDTTPQLGGDLDVQSNSIVSVSQNIPITPSGSDLITTNVSSAFLTKIKNLQLQSAMDTKGNYIFTSTAGALKSDANFVEINDSLYVDDDIQLGTNQSLIFGGSGTIKVEDSGEFTVLGLAKNSTAVNYVKITADGTGTGPTIEAQGTDTNIDLKLKAKGTGKISVTGEIVSDTTFTTPALSMSGSTPTITGVTDADLTISTTGTGDVYINAPTDQTVTLNSGFVSQANGYSRNTYPQRLAQYATGSIPSIGAHADNKGYQVFDTTVNKTKTHNGTTWVTEGGIALTDLSVTTGSASGNGALAYNNTTGVFTFTPASVPSSTDALSEGSSNLYYTDTRARAVSIENVSEDTTPQLGGDLDVNGNKITSASNSTDIMFKPSQSGLTSNQNGVTGNWGWGGAVAHINGPLTVGMDDTPDHGQLYNGGIQVTTTEANWSSLALKQYSDDDVFGNVWFVKSRSDTKGTNTASEDEDRLGGFYASGWNGQTYNDTHAACYFVADGNHTGANHDAWGLATTGNLGGFLRVEAVPNGSVSKKKVAHFKGDVLHVNPDNADVDFRVDGDTTDNLLKVDAGTETLSSVCSKIDFTNLPTSDPSVAGRLWNDSGTLKVSAG